MLVLCDCHLCAHRQHKCIPRHCSAAAATSGAVSAAAQVLQRAVSGGVEVLVVFTTDFEKAESLTRLAKENAGCVYCMVGVARYYMVGMARYYMVGMAQHCMVGVAR